MSIKVMSMVWDHSDHKGSALLLMLALADFGDEDGRSIFPSVTTLGHKCRMTPRNVQILLHRLTDSGELVIDEGAGPNGTHQYRVMTAILSAKPAKTFRAKSFRVRKNEVGSGEESGTPGVKALSPDPSVNHQEPPDDIYAARLRQLRRKFTGNAAAWQRLLDSATPGDPSALLARIERAVYEAQVGRR